MNTTTVVDPAAVLAAVDARSFRRLFVEYLGWYNPDHAPLSYLLNGVDYVFTQVAGYKGVRVWTCPVVPDYPIQRALDALLGQSSTERLVIFANEERQEWRWPRKAQTGGLNAKLMAHPHAPGERNQSLTDRLAAIAIDFDEDVSLVDMLARMRDAFNAESESASIQAARLMGRLYTELEASDVPPEPATLLLARILFLVFADDSDMWVGRPDLFKNYLAQHTTSASLHTHLIKLFHVLNTEERLRDLPEGDPLRVFRYVNGGLFRDDLSLSCLTPQFRDALLDACEFDWSVISPAVFGSMFQTVKDKVARRGGGEHYTTEENILKTIGPLFLDELHDRFEAARNDRGQLTRLHNDLGRLRVMDPACGCGNFLIVAYRRLRALELEILKRRRELDVEAGSKGKRHALQGVFEVQEDLKVRLDHFYGIEIDTWPARIAQTALLLVDHLANQEVAEEFGVAPDRLPIRISPQIYGDVSALAIDWATVVPPSEDVVIVGNPPFLGHKERTAKQGEELRQAWGTAKIAHLDYVTAWYAKALTYFGGLPGRWAFVSTNSIVQGESVPLLFGPIFEAGWRIKFAHRTFQWTSEAAGAAGVQVVIVGFARRVRTPRLFDYVKAKGPAIEVAADIGTINAYLVDGPNVMVAGRRSPLNSALPEISAGSTGIDWNHLTVTRDDVEEVRADPVALKYLRRYVGGKELIHSLDRWCLWMAGPEFDARDIARSPILAERVAAVEQRRRAADRITTQGLARIPHRFGEIRQPEGPYLAMPQTFSENRLFATADRLPADVIASIKIFTAPDPDGFLFAIFSSSMFITWQKTVGGRLESRPSFSSSIVWNNLPLPAISTASRVLIADAGRGVLAARGHVPGMTLAELYKPELMSSALIAAHADLDAVVDRAFGAAGVCRTELERQEILFARYQELTATPGSRG